MLWKAGLKLAKPEVIEFNAVILMKMVANGSRGKWDDVNQPAISQEWVKLVSLRLLN